MAGTKDLAELKKYLELLEKCQNSYDDPSYIEAQTFCTFLNRKKVVDGVLPLLFSLSEKNSYVQYRLGLMFYHGWGVDKDEKKAEELFLQATKNNNADAMNNLGRMYAKRENYDNAIKMVQGIGQQEKQICTL